jgi:phosphate-selective porin OprO and OprP
MVRAFVATVPFSQRDVAIGLVAGRAIRLDRLQRGRNRGGRVSLVASKSASRQGERKRLNCDPLFDAEFAWIHGPLSFQTEFMAVPVDRTAGSDVLFHAGYAFVSYFLTGEHRPYIKQQGIHDRVVPFENFFRVRDEDGCIVNGRGAWEVAARWSYIDLTDDNIQGGVKHNYTLGLNWYLNPYTRVKWEFIHSNLDRAPIGDSNANIFGMRFDIDF